MNEEFFTGVLGDPREDPRVQAGYSIDEILAASAPFDWRKKKDSELTRFPVWNQAQSSACVAFAKAKQVSIRVFLETGVWIDFSPSSIYQLRNNKPALGMEIANANEIVNKRGVTLEALMKSQNMSEAQINAVKRSRVADLVAQAIAEAVVSYLYVPVNIDRIAQTIQAGKAVSLLTFGTNAEYARKKPVVIESNLQYAGAPVRHEIVSMEYYIDAQGDKVIHIEDSAHFGGFHERDFTEEWLAKRVILADAIDLFTFEPGTGDKPRYDGTIISVQKCLRYEGLFPADVDYVESYGPVTKKGVRDFQVKHGLHPTGVDNIGPATQAKLRELYP